MADKNLCIPFTITDDDGRHHQFEAVGIGDDLPTNEEALRRAGERVIQSDEDWKLVNRYSYQIPKKLADFTALLTKRPWPPSCSCRKNDVTTLFRDSGFWIGNPVHLRDRTGHCLGMYTGDILVLRRSAV